MFEKRTVTRKNSHTDRAKRLRFTRGAVLVADAATRTLAGDGADTTTTGRLLDAIASPAVTLDTTGHIVLANRAWRRFAIDNGASPDDVSTGIDYLAACGDEADAVAMGIGDVIAGRLTTFRTDYPCHSATAERWYRMTATPFGGGALVVHTDITDQYVRLNRWLSGTDIAIIELRPDLSLSYANESWRRVAGLDEWTSPIHPVDVVTLNERLARCWLDREPFTLDTRVGDGWYRLAAHVELAGDGSVAGIVVVGVDVSDESAAVARTAVAAERDRLSARLTGSVMRQLRTTGAALERHLLTAEQDDPVIEEAVLRLERSIAELYSMVPGTG